MISGVRKVYVPVGDQAKAKEFWTNSMGFSVARDETYGDERWIEVEPPDRRIILVLTLRRSDQPRQPPPASDQLPDSELFFDCADIEQTYAELTERGVTFPVPPSKQHFGWWALFEDNEGTRYALGQWDEA